ncbi:hypothetical protein AMAG_10081 [Allomyces macrogynus ATCC 38327]|uniref:Uncharacterized protein n=1 Tax=Allomyces macrogynus (strain ATCC 38327) TaxID=578462 RepID=A0A0L0SQE2_ALLM3|nr:hypothetical protein AMAG_10081 [Allomyces macrogynus ATCC 38327]|eukprot:KNE64731.1 hypothetical protein AMAG_10081 [Allomyces macrogynus ATCC 38327]
MDDRRARAALLGATAAFMHAHILALALAAELLDDEHDDLDLDHLRTHAPADQFWSLPALFDMPHKFDIGTQIVAQFALAMTLRRLAHGDTGMRLPRSRRGLGVMRRRAGARCASEAGALSGPHHRTSVIQWLGTHSVAPARFTSFVHAIRAHGGDAPEFMGKQRALVGFLGTTVLAPCNGTGTDTDGVQFQAIVKPDGQCADLIGPHLQRHAPARVFRLGETGARLAPLRVQADGEEEERVAVVYADKKSYALWRVMEKRPLPALDEMVVDAAGQRREKVGVAE